MGLASLYVVQALAVAQEQQKRDAAEAARNAAEAKARKEQVAKEAEMKAKALAAEQAASEVRSCPHNWHWISCRMDFSSIQALRAA